MGRISENDQKSAHCCESLGDWPERFRKGQSHVGIVSIVERRARNEMGRVNSESLLWLLAQSGGGA
jgi:hypothetical protein